ncbi:MAG: alpha/beta fold hydrolase [Firmicutes bacterium]|nr:alpha/beta fold hydrolase [Bacillota bacterium]
MRRFAVVIFFFISVVMVGQVNAQTSSFLLYLGGTEVGGEEYWLSDNELKTEGNFSVGGQTLQVAASLKNAGDVVKYQANLLSGASFTATIKNEQVTVEVGPLKRSFPLEKPYMVLDNNVFAHYEQVLALMAKNDDEQTISVIVPSLVLANQNPVITGLFKRVGEVQYQTKDGNLLILEEYVLTMPGNLQMRLHGQGEKLIHLDIPMQAAEVFREGYVDITPAEDRKEQFTHLRTEEFAVKNGQVTLAGTLSLPQGEGPFPAIVLNSGSGPQDRNGNTPPAFMTNMFRIFAEELTKVGIAVLAYDERGVGESTGDYDLASVQDLLSDIEVLLDFLEDHPQVVSNRIAMLGHSEGAYFAPVFADRLSAIVLLAGPSITLDRLMEEQLDYQLSKPWLSEQEKALLQEYQPLIKQVIVEASEGKDVSEVIPLNLEWLRQHMELTPLDNLANVTSPVLIVQGEEDLKVMPYHAQVLADTLKSNGNEAVTVQYLAGTTHDFTFFPYDNEDFDPLDPFKLNPALVKIVVEWLDQTL